LYLKTIETRIPQGIERSLIERLWLLPVTNEWTLQLITFPLLSASVQQNAKRRHGGPRHFVHHFLHVFLSMCLLSWECLALLMRWITLTSHWVIGPRGEYRPWNG
jgi:hypothetical protein